GAGLGRTLVSGFGDGDGRPTPNPPRCHPYLLGAQVSILRKERRYFRSMASSYECKAVIARQAWSHSKSRIQAMEAQIRALQKDVDVLQRERIRDEDRLTAHIQHEHDMFRDRVHATEARP
ncbi:hypothetical protein Tco_1268090, partial [Tanacetum coccineum]